MPVLKEGDLLGQPLDFALLLRTIYGTRINQGSQIGPAV
ncbi:hypothetical protein B4113_2740 [Geobacillus sp. B4113_201601]|nr:hypothetical protein B4113_2740 [Geobacillus sp. B4113_201601]